MAYEIELPQELLDEQCQTYGFTEDEARVFAFLSAARNRYDDLPEVPYASGPFNDAIRDAINLLALSVVRRDHPDGWRTVSESEDRDSPDEPA